MSFAIRVEDLGKRYRLGMTHAGSIREMVNRTVGRLLGRRHGLSIARRGRSAIGQWGSLSIARRQILRAGRCHGILRRGIDRCERRRDRHRQTADGRGATPDRASARAGMRRNRDKPGHRTERGQNER